MTERLESVSVAELRALYRASARFHDAAPWERLTSNQPLRVRVAPHGGDSGAARIWYVAISGNGSWEGRGLHFYGSMRDLVHAATTTGAEPVEQTILQFFGRGSTPFQALNHVEELGLEVSRKDGCEGEKSYPHWYRTTVTLAEMSRQMMFNLEFVRTFQNTPPRHGDLGSLTLSTLAITQLVTDPRRFVYATATGTATAVGELSFMVDGTNVTVEILRLNDPRALMMYVNDPAYLETLSIGDLKKCNFCRKPKALLTEQGLQLLACSRCKPIDYCAKQCQTADWPRHKKECKTLARSQGLLK
mmetsp:Transcript_10057/g.26389  ORF Transcript_10057/g.26389 Transcript_10057/m.26389 type:complete len:303 (-) Transcript_10057:96-1004(-)